MSFVFVILEKWKNEKILFRIFVHTFSQNKTNNGDACGQADQANTAQNRAHICPIWWINYNMISQYARRATVPNRIIVQIVFFVCFIDLEIKCDFLVALLVSLLVFCLVKLATCCYWCLHLARVCWHVQIR